MSRLQWGILGVSRFAQAKIIPAIGRCRYAEVAAIASRDLARAQKAAAQFGIAKAYAGYERLLEDPAIDVVYIPLANHLHVPWSIRALEAGKHVLCEKPIGLSAAEALQLMAASSRYPHLKVMEAFMYRFHPQWRRARQIVEQGGIGELRAIQSLFSFFNDDAGNIRNQPAAGGGTLFDIGCYGVSVARFIFAGEPRGVMGMVAIDPVFKTDRLVSGMLEFDRGVAGFLCSTQLAPFQRVHIFGTSGRIEIEIPFNPPPDEPTRLRHESGSRSEVIEIGSCDQYALEVDEFSQAILNNTASPVPLSDAVANMRVIDALFESGRCGGRVAIR